MRALEGLRRRRLAALAIACVAVFAPRLARAQVATFDTSHTLYHEAPTRTNMTVYTPGATVTATPATWITVRGSYEADVVSGASVATKAGPAYQAVNPGVDVVTTASVHDLRQSPSGGLTLRKGDVSVLGTYTYGTEHDYRSHAMFVAARTEAYEHNTQLEISYARNFDSVCDRVQGASDPFARRRALEDSSGCFTSSATRTRRDLDIDGFQATWSQAWTPVLATQLVYTAQLLDGFQSNPYRSIVLGQGLKAQEHHPEARARQSITARANLWVKPLKLAVRASLRAYRDTWDVASGTGELEVERYVFAGFRLGARGRYYKQTGAVFWSDDYTGGAPPLGPKGQYWTGDRELSPFSSASVGARLNFTMTPEAKIARIVSSLKLGASADVMQFWYDEYTLGGTPISNARAYIASLTFGLLF